MNRRVAVEDLVRPELPDTMFREMSQSTPTIRSDPAGAGTIASSSRQPSSHPVKIVDPPKTTDEDDIQFDTGVSLDKRQPENSGDRDSKSIDPKSEVPKSEGSKGKGRLIDPVTPLSAATTLGPGSASPFSSSMRAKKRALGGPNPLSKVMTLHPDSAV